MNVPNRLSILRIILVPVMAILFLLDFEWSIVAAIIIFVLACFTDFLDGYIARKTNQVTDLGKLLDPIADKMLVCFGLFLIVESNCLSQGIIPIGVTSFCAALIICRELLISIVRQLGASKNIIIHANCWGKIKAVFQYIAIPILMLLKLKDGLIAISEVMYEIIYWVGFGSLLVATILTVVSAIVYIIQNKMIFAAVTKSDDK